MCYVTYLLMCVYFSRQADVVAESNTGRKDTTAAAKTKLYKDKKRKNKEER